MDKKLSNLSKTEAKQYIEEFFQKSSFKPEELKKIKRLAMKHRIRLGENKKKFCKKCLFKLKGIILINNGYKNIFCSSCNYQNRHKIKDFKIKLS